MQKARQLRPVQLIQSHLLVLKARYVVPTFLLAYDSIAPIGIERVVRGARPRALCWIQSHLLVLKDAQLARVCLDDADSIAPIGIEREERARGRCECDGFNRTYWY